MEKDQIKEDKKEEKSEIEFASYVDQPEKLFSVAQEQFNKNNFEEGINILEQSINLAIKKFGGEEKVELAQFYNKYADGLIQKLMTSNEDFLNLDEEKSQIEAQEPKDGQPPKNNNEEEKDKKEEKTAEKKEDKKDESNKELKESKEQKDDIGDDEIVYENLNAANLLLKNYLKDYEEKDPKSLDKSIINYYHQ